GAFLDLHEALASRRDGARTVAEERDRGAFLARDDLGPGAALEAPEALLAELAAERERNAGPRRGPPRPRAPAGAVGGQHRRGTQLDEARDDALLPRGGVRRGRGVALAEGDRVVLAPEGPAPEEEELRVERRAAGRHRGILRPRSAPGTGARDMFRARAMGAA